jgi:hypothetical protein
LPRRKASNKVFSVIPEASGQAIAFVRQPKRFKLNQYVQLVKCDLPIVAFAVLDPDLPVRVPNIDYFRWAPGTYRPAMWNNTGSFIWITVEMERYSPGFTVDYQAIDTARGWNPQAFFNASLLSQAMCLMTQRFANLANNTANWITNQTTGTGNFADANVLNNGAGTWDQASSDPSSPHFNAIKKSILQAIINIQLGTNGQMMVQDMKLVLGPLLAAAIANTSEISNQLARQEKVQKTLEGIDPSISVNYGIPNPLYGLEVVIEDSPIVTELPNTTSTPATSNRNFIWPATNAMICSRIGGIDGNYGSPTATTLQRYFYKYDMAVEAFDRPLHKLFESYVVDQYKEVLAAPRSGYLVTSCQ